MSDVIKQVTIRDVAGGISSTADIGAKAENVVLQDGRTVEDLAQDKQNQIQFDTMPTAGEDYVDEIYQYTGATTTAYTNGYFYKCVSDGEVSPTYSWDRVDVQPGGSGSGDMLASVYDPDGNVAEAGGIEDYVESKIDLKFDVMPSTADLFALPNNTLFYTKGFYEPTDGNGGYYFITTTSTRGALVITYNGVNRRLIALESDGKLRDSINPCRYGVRAVDNLSSDITLENTYATQNSDIISRIYLPTNHATLKFPIGKFVFADTLDITSRQLHIEGSMPSTPNAHTITSTDDISGTILCFPFLEDGEYGIKTKGDVRNIYIYGSLDIYNFDIDRTKITTAPNEVVTETIKNNIKCMGIYNNGSGVKIDNVSIMGFYTGFYMPAASNVYIHNIYVTKCHIGLNLSNDTKCVGVYGANVHTLIKVRGALVSVVQARCDSLVHLINVEAGNNITISDADGDWCTEELVTIGSDTSSKTVSSLRLDNIHGRCCTLNYYNIDNNPNGYDVRDLGNNPQGYGIIRVLPNTIFTDSHISINGTKGHLLDNSGDVNYEKLFVPNIVFTMDGTTNKSIERNRFDVPIESSDDILRIIQTKTYFTARVDSANNTYYIDGTTVKDEPFLKDLSDTNITSPKVGQVLKYNGTQWVNSTEGRYNVLDYGLKGDNSTDNSDALNALLALVPKNSSAVIYFPKGRYKFTQPIVIRDSGETTPLGITFLGDTVSTKDYNDGTNVGSPDSTLIYSGEANTTFIKGGTDCWTFNFEGIHLTCLNGYAMTVNTAPFDDTLPYRVFTSSVTKDGIVGIGKSNALNLKNCTFTGFSGAAVEAPVHTVIDNCSFCKNKIGVDAEYDTVIRNCWFNYCGTAINVRPNNPTSQYSWTTFIINDTWVDQCTQGIYTSAKTFGLWASDIQFDMFDEAAIVCKNLVDSQITGQIHRAGMMYADIVDANRTTELAPYTDAIVADKIETTVIELYSNKRNIGKGNHSAGLCPSRFVTAKNGTIESSEITNHAAYYAEIIDSNMVTTLTNTTVVAQDFNSATADPSTDIDFTTLFGGE